MSQQRLIIRLRLRDARDGFLGHDDDGRGRLRIDIAKRDHEIVLVHDPRRNLPRRDLFKKGLAHNGLTRISPINRDCPVEKQLLGGTGRAATSSARAVSYTHLTLPTIYSV